MYDGADTAGKRRHWPGRRRVLLSGTKEANIKWVATFFDIIHP